MGVTENENVNISKEEQALRERRKSIEAIFASRIEQLNLERERELSHIDNQLLRIKSTAGSSRPT